MAVIRGIPRAVGGLRCSSPHLAETAGPAQGKAYELRVYRPPRQRKGSGSRAHLSDFIDHAVQQLQLVLALLLVGLVDDLLSQETTLSFR